MSKGWSDEERGGSGLDAAGKAKSRDNLAYGRLRNFGFSREFMVDHWYVPERDRRLPHTVWQQKACASCGTVLRNDFKMFPKEVYGDKKLGRHTTGDTCRACVSAAAQRGRSTRSEADRVARAAYDAHGDEMWERKPPN